MNDTGDVIGVSAKDPGGDVNVYSKTCLIAAGNLLGSNIVKKLNPEFSAGYQPKYVHTSSVFTGG